MFKKSVVYILFFACLNFIFNIYASNGTSPLRASLWPSAGQVPADLDCNGFSFGLVTFGDKTKVIGLDLGFASLTKYVTGAQISFYNSGDDSKGCQLGPVNTVGYIDGAQVGFVNNSEKEVKGAQVGFVNINKDVNGAQVGLYNTADNTISGPQIGLVNVDKTGEGIQIGLINIMDNGFIKVCPIINMAVHRNK